MSEKSSSLSSNSPALQLVSEIFESLKVKNVKSDHKKDIDGSLERTQNSDKTVNKSQPVDPQTPLTENFESLKSRLRKVSKSVEDNIECSDYREPETVRRSGDPGAEVEEGTEQNGKEKRSSTGSITNLKRMWEGQRNVPDTSGFKPPKNNNTKEHSENVNTRVTHDSGKPTKSEKPSPKAETERKTETAVEDQQQTNPETKSKPAVPIPKTDKNKPIKVKRVWPPPSLSAPDHDKPAVPTKPMVSKKVNPIYATPSQRVDHSSRGNIYVYFLTDINHTIFATLLIVGFDLIYSLQR